MGLTDQTLPNVEVNISAPQTYPIIDWNSRYLHPFSQLRLIPSDIPMLSSAFALAAGFEPRALSCDPLGLGALTARDQADFMVISWRRVSETGTTCGKHHR